MQAQHSCVCTSGLLTGALGRASPSRHNSEGSSTPGSVLSKAGRRLHGLGTQHVGAVTGQSRTEQRAECEEGMPPESTMALKSQMPLRQRRVNTCSAASCSAHLMTAGGTVPTALRDRCNP